MSSPHGKMGRLSPGPPRVAMPGPGLHGCSSAPVSRTGQRSETRGLEGPGSSFSQMAPSSRGPGHRSHHLWEHVCRARAGRAGPYLRLPTGSAESASSPACRCHRPCAHCVACPLTPRRWTGPPMWRSSSRPTRPPAGAATRRYHTAASWGREGFGVTPTGRRQPPPLAEEPPHCPTPSC